MTTALNELPSARTQTDRRLVMRLVDYWEDIRGTYEFPLIHRFDISSVDGLEENGFLLELDDEDLENSRFRFFGSALIRECGEDLAGRPVTSVPRGSLLCRLTDHFYSVLGNRCPMGFEAEFADKDCQEILYRGIMMPVSDTGASINYIIGAINCRRQRPAEASDTTEMLILDSALHRPANGVPAADGDVGMPPAMPGPDDDTNPGPADETPLLGHLRDCRAAVAALEEAECRSRQALYVTLQKAFVLADLAVAEPDTYRRLLAVEGITPQARAPFTPIVKLVFGPTYNKTRLSEYATVLAYAERMGQTPETLMAFLETHEGGIKGCVTAERAHRRGDASRPDTIDPLKTALRERPSLGRIADPDADRDGESAAGEFVVLLGRRGQAGQIDVITLLDETPSGINRLVRRAAKAEGAAKDECD